MNQKGNIILVILVLFLLLGGIVFGFFFGSNYKLEKKNSLSETNPTPTITTQPTTPLETPTPTDIPWQTYTNTEYGFTISYPEGYQALDDETNLYGWPNAIVLIYGGGQSYDLPIEIWDSASEYQQKYQSPITEFNEQTYGNKIITLVNVNHNPEVDEIIDTFAFIKN